MKSVRFVSENPEEKFFTALKDFRFQDRGAFDFRWLAEEPPRVFHKGIGWFCYMDVHPVMLIDLEIFTLAESIES